MKVKIAVAVLLLIVGATVAVAAVVEKSKQTDVALKKEFVCEEWNGKRAPVTSENKTEKNGAAKSWVSIARTDYGVMLNAGVALSDTVYSWSVGRVAASRGRVSVNLNISEIEDAAQRRTLVAGKDIAIALPLYVKPDTQSIAVRFFGKALRVKPREFRCEAK